MWYMQVCCYEQNCHNTKRLGTASIPAEIWRQIYYVDIFTVNLPPLYELNQVGLTHEQNFSQMTWVQSLNANNNVL